MSEPSVPSRHESDDDKDIASFVEEFVTDSPTNLIFVTERIN